MEKFFLRLKKLLPASDVEELKSLVASSRELHQDLINIYTEAGKNLKAGDVLSVPPGRGARYDRRGRELILEIDSALQKTGRKATIFPGHGECYADRDLRS